MALACIMRSMSIQSIHATLEQAIAHHQAGDLPQAEELYRAILREDPQMPDALHLLGVLAFQAGHPEPARQLIVQALTQRPESAHYLSSLSQVLQDSDDDAALSEVYQRLLALEGPSAELCLKLGQSLGRLRRFTEAEQALAQARQLDPDNGWVFNSQGNVHQMQGDYAQAERCYQQALGCGIESADVLNNLAVALHEQSRYQEAISTWRRALELNPEHAESHVNAGMHLLLQGDWLEGQQEYDVWRWRAKDEARRSFFDTVPFWDGQPLTTETLLIHAEQGFGDTLQFIRWLPWVQERVEKLILECQPELLELLRANYPELTILARGEDLPAFERQIPLMSLPRVSRYVPEDSPPYLRPRDVLTPQLSGDSPKIGLVWSSGFRPDPMRYRLYQKKSLELACFAPLFGLKNLNWYSLQVGSDKDQLTAADFPVRDLAAELPTFQATADAIAQLDLVISVDTAVAHLAGALGKEVWMLVSKVPEWRWELEREDTRWYPTMRLFRQPVSGDWESVVAQLGLALRERYPQT